MITNSEIHPDTKIWNEQFVNIYESNIGRDCNIGSFVEIGNSLIGSGCKIQAYAFICTAIIRNGVFIGPRVTFTNVKHPRADAKGFFQGITVKEGASIGASAVILPGITIGEYAVIGAGSVVTRDVEAYSTVCGNPARKMDK